MCGIDGSAKLPASDFMPSVPYGIKRRTEEKAYPGDFELDPRELAQVVNFLNKRLIAFSEYRLKKLMSAGVSASKIISGINDYKKEISPS